MRLIITFFFIISLFTGFISSQTLEERANAISKEEMQSVVEFLGNDLVEGRAPGTRGGNLSEIYMKSIFKLLGMVPGFNNDYMQPILIKGFTIDKLTLNGNGVTLNYLDDVVGSWVGSDENFNLKGDAVFVGFGITAGLWKWDDFKNVDVKDKIIIARVNDPGFYNNAIFEGKALTYFGRWTYHIEEAIRRGAAGILLIHTDETAGYGWNVVKNSWSGEEIYLESDISNNLKFRGWISEASFKKFLETKKIDINKLYELSKSPKFKPIPLGFSIDISGTAKKRELVIHNVVAEIPGKTDKKIVITAHIDHFGIGLESNGDAIFNGAIDNASAVSAMMVTAKILKEFQKDLYYSVVFVACQAEEAGLLGSKYFVQTYKDRDKIIANINYESTPVWGKTTDFMAVGGEYSTIEDMLKPILEKEGLQYSYFSLTNQGFYFRSDQFPFARYNIPAVWMSAGENDDSGQKKYPQYWKTNYHTVNDEYDPNWPMDGMKETIKMTLLLIEHINKTQAIPQWKRSLPFPLLIDKK